MYFKYLFGSLALYGLLVTSLASFLLLQLIRKMKISLTITNLPPDLEAAMNRQLADTVYAWSIPIWMAVAKMEVAGFESYIYTRFNNPWNMRPSEVRDHTQNGYMETTNNGRFATYANLDDAAQDILLYMKARRYPVAEMELYNFVQLMGKKGYYGTEPFLNYYRKVVAWLQR